MIIHGDSTEVLKTLGENSVDAVVTDPPYGLKFMGKKWDYDVPTNQLWSQVLRVLKPGGHLLSFGGTRTYHRMAIEIELAGFEIRDQIQWLYGSGFPKSHNIGEGRGTALKPANEPIVLARKPLSEITIRRNVERWGTGALNIDRCRIAGHNPSIDRRASARKTNWDNRGGGIMNDQTNPERYKEHRPTEELGRWPANLILDEEAAQMLDEQVGPKPGPWGKNSDKSKGETSMFGIGAGVDNERFRDGNKVSRFFYVAKASKREREDGSFTKNYTAQSGEATRLPTKNHHPTVKPLKLMEYLCKLITPPNGTILDPFCGSGSTGVAAKRLSFNFIGIERELEYVEIAKHRIEHESSE